MQSFADGRVRLHAGDCLDVLKTLAENSVDSVVCDPPYGLAFMGRHWDAPDNIAHRPDVWREVLRVLKPGGHLIAFGGTRTYHRLTVAVEDAGFEIRDMVPWLYGQGFPKSLDVSKAIDKAAGAKREVGDYRSAAHAIKRKPARERQHEGYTRPYMDDPGLYDASLRVTAPATEAAEVWSGWGTALKPALEPAVLARKPLSERTVAANVLRWGTGAINVDGCRIGIGEDPSVNYAGPGQCPGGGEIYGRYADRYNGARVPHPASLRHDARGRWPANLVHDGSDEVLAAFPQTTSGLFKGKRRPDASRTVLGGFSGDTEEVETYGDSGSAARFFYCGKASRAERAGSKHPTVKPLKLMRWLVRLVTPPGGVVLDPFAGTGTTAQAALAEGFDAVLIEREAEYRLDIARRLRASAVGSRAAPTAASRSLGRTIGPVGLKR